MSNFTSIYRPPGVYTLEEPSPLVAQPSTFDSSTVAIVGPSVGYQRNSEAIILNGVEPVLLSRLGINQATLVVTRSDGSTADAGDYDLVVDSGEDETPSTADDTLTIARSSGTTINDGEAVVVTYRYTDPHYYSPHFYTDYNAVRDTHGNPLDPDTGEIVSPLSLAAKFAFDNGATRLLLQAVPGTASAVSVPDLNNGYAKILTLDEAAIIVPLPVGIGGTVTSPGDVHHVGTGLKNHLNTAESNGTRRVGILGYHTSALVDPDLIAAEIESPRAMVAFPNRLNYFNGALDQTQTISGYYLAAAYAGRMASLPVNTPLTRKGISGFSGLPSDVMADLTRANKDRWSRSGVAVAEVSARRGLVVRHAVSTAPGGGVLTREMSITRARDTMISSVAISLEGADLIGSPIVEETPVRIKGVVAGVLETMVGDGTIVGYQGLTVRQTSGDPSIIEVRFQYRPTYPLNYINVIFGVDPTLGVVTNIGDGAVV